MDNKEKAISQIREALFGTNLHDGTYLDDGLVRYLQGLPEHEVTRVQVLRIVDALALLEAPIPPKRGRFWLNLALFSTFFVGASVGIVYGLSFEHGAFWALLYVFIIGLVGD